MLSDGKMFDQVLVWLVGSVAGRGMDQLVAVLPYMGAGMVIALLLSGQLNILAMGDTVAQGLGQRTGRIKLGYGGRDSARRRVGCGSRSDRVCRDHYPAYRPLFHRRGLPLDLALLRLVRGLALSVGRHRLKVHRHAQGSSGRGHDRAARSTVFRIYRKKRGEKLMAKPGKLEVSAAKSTILAKKKERFGSACCCP